MKLNKRMLFGIVSIALAAVIALIGIPAVLNQGNDTVKVIRAKSQIEKGSVITAEMVEVAEVGSQGLPTGVATDTAQVVGTYAVVDIMQGDYFLPTKVSSTSPKKDAILEKLPDGMTAVSMSVQSLAGALSNKLRAEDIVSLYCIENGEVVNPAELQYVRIIAVTNANGTNIEDAIGDESRMAATLTFLVTERQAKKMIEIENSSPLHVALVTRGNSKKAKRLLEEQTLILEQIEYDEQWAELEMGDIV